MASSASDRFENLQLLTSIQLSGPTFALSVSGFIGGILDGLADAVKGSIGLIKRLGCTPTCQRQDRPWLIDTLP
jgi:hypothetical protein